jgi:hypothetical protein
VEISGDYAYVTDSYPGVLVFDISDPTAPALAGSCDTPGLAEAIVLHGDYAYVADHDGDLRIIEIFQREYGADSNVARSLAFFESDDSILQARLEATCSDSILWEMSADSGGTWQEIAPGSGYQVLTSPGTDLVWRSTHTYVSGGVNPLCSGLSIDWLYTFPFIASVTDIPGDQGHQVSLSWTRSGYDVVGSAAPITQYAVYRRIDYAATRASGPVEAVSLASSARGHGEDITPGVLYPPGDWHFVTTVPARTEDEYAVVVPTLEDSTVSDGMQYTAFFVSALTATPGVYFDSPVDSGYSVDNLAPAPPLNLAMPSATGLEWDECPEEDFDYFTVYGSAAPAMDHTAVLIGYTVGTAHDVSGDVYDYYHVTATDFSGNEGDASSVDNTYADVETEHELPIAFALRGNHPNPFASETRIAFELPEACSVTLEVFDTEGRVVKVLSEREWAGGRHSVVWAGENESGASASPGVYFIRMRAGRFEATRKMMLMK